jgi:dihydroxyacetone kinase-like predicted kinase
MAANQAASIVDDKEIIVIPTKTVPQGITAVINYLPDVSAEENKEAMVESIATVKTGQVTYAVRDTEIDGFEIKENDYMGIGDKTILAVGTDMNTVTIEMLEKMIDEDTEMVSIYYGSESSEEEAEVILEAIEEKYPDVDIEINDDGQPIYYYVISVE